MDEMIADFGKRPATLREAVRRVKDGEQGFDIAIREFLDSFYSLAEHRNEAIAQRPDKLDALRDAYVAAVAEHLANVYALQVPRWTEEQGNDLHQPVFAGGLDSLRGVLFAESPTAFRKRLIFVSKNALSRPRAAVDGGPAAPKP
jgi:hypothetical protein